MKLQRICTIILIIIAFILLMRWFEWRDEQVRIGADIYEKCIEEQYGMSPARWYAEQGEYPECVKINN